jgi:hypothetical protein
MLPELFNYTVKIKNYYPKHFHASFRISIPLVTFLHPEVILSPIPLPAQINCLWIFQVALTTAAEA